VLVTFVACLELSIFRRRRIVARRRLQESDRQVETQSFHSDVSGHPSLLPRYFPRTLSSAPPPYVGPAEESSVTTQSDVSSIEMYIQIPPHIHSTLSHPATVSVSPLVTRDKEPSDLPPPFSAVSSPSPPVHISAIEVAPVLLSAANVPSSRPTRSLRRSRSSSLLDIDSATISSIPSAIEARSLSAEY